MDLPMGPLFHNAAMVAADTRMDKADPITKCNPAIYKK